MRRKSGGAFRLLKDGVIVLMLIAGGALIIAKLDGMNQQRFFGRFTAVDGDTVAQGRERFRLIGIDAPELRQQCSRDGTNWPCGEDARDHLRTLLQSGAVECRGNSEDKYRRLLVRCSSDGEDIAGRMVAAGFAVATEYVLFSKEQADAQNRRAGIWAGDFQQPRDWRREHKAADMDTPFAGLLELLRHLMGW